MTQQSFRRIRSWRFQLVWRWLVWLGGALWISACAPARPQQHNQQLVVFAAASLREAFGPMATAFLQQNPGVDVRLHFAGTQELRTQLEHGAAADVFASADERHMAALEQAGQVMAPSVFARNEPVLVVASHLAGQVRSLGDLPNAERVGLGAEEVPIGRYTMQVLERAAGLYGANFRSLVQKKVVSREASVRQVLAKVSLGEADAAIVYRTDAQAAQGKVAVVQIPPEINVMARYPLAVTVSAAQPLLAQQWLKFVLSKQGQQILQTAGFAPPDEGQ